MTFAQIRIDEEEGSFKSYFNYEFALVCDRQLDRHDIITLDFFGSERYYPEEDSDRAYEEEREFWTIPSNEVKLIFTEEN